MILDAILCSDASDQASLQIKSLIQNMQQKEYSLTEQMALLDLSTE